MTNNSIIISLLANGGWCQLHHSNKVALINIVGGRLLFYNDEISIIEKFDLHIDKLNGYFVVLNKTKQRLKKATWIKQILTIGGKTIRDGNIPKGLYAETLHDFLHELKTSREQHTLRLVDAEVNCRISDFSDSDLTIEVLSTLPGPAKMKIDFSDIICFELRTQKTKQFK